MPELPNNVQSNLEKLKEITESNRSATHIYLRRVGEDNLVVEVPLSHAETTIRREKAWEVVASNKEMDDVVEQIFNQPDETETQPPADTMNEEEKKAAADKLAELETKEPVVPPKPSEAKKPRKPRAKKKAAKK